MDKVRVIMHGCNGKMGRTISELIDRDEDMEIVAGVDVNTVRLNRYPVYGVIGDCAEEADVVIDFSTSAAVDGLLDYCEERGVPCVLCTTGLSQEQLARVNKVSEKTAVLKSANMSMGINLLLKILKEAAPVLAAVGFDMEIVEKHHNQKIDAPSGTALALADAMNEALAGGYEYTYDRSRDRKPRQKYEIGISAVRGGTIIGDHDVIFAGTDEVITFSHRAYSKAVFGSGAVQAAKFLKGRRAGLYSMGDVIRERSVSESEDGK